MAELKSSREGIFEIFVRQRFPVIALPYALCSIESGDCWIR